MLNLKKKIQKTLNGLLDDKKQDVAIETLDCLMKGSNHSVKASEYAYDVDEVKAWMRREKKYHGKKLAFLTFDDGPSRYTPGVLDILKERSVQGTFFICGSCLASTRDDTIMNRYIKEGHGVAIHSYSHDYAYLYPERVANPDRIVTEFKKTLDLMKERLGCTFDTKVFRFPGGSMSWRNIDAAKEALRALGVKDIDWNALSGDAKAAAKGPATNEAQAKYVMKTLYSNKQTNVAVILMHDHLHTTQQYLDMVIDELQGKGFVFGILE